MKIAIIKRRCSLKIGGSERYCVNLTRQLKNRGHQVTVIGESIDPELKTEINFVSVPVSRWTSATKNYSFAMNAGKAAQHGKYDLVYALGRSFGVDVVRVTERLQAHWVNVYYQQNWWRALQKINPRHRTLINLEREIYQTASTRKIITQSSLDRTLIQEYYQIPEEKIRTIPNGIDTRVFNLKAKESRKAVRQELGLDEETPVLIFASMDFEGKGLHSILKGLSDPRLQKCQLLVLGNGPVNRFKQIAERWGVLNQVNFLGRRNQIEQYYGAGDLFILPTEYEPFPNVNLEAMACGLPVITTRNSGSIDFLKDGETGYFMSSRHASQEFADFTACYLQMTPVQQKLMTERCAVTAAGYTLERNVTSTISVFEEVIKEKGHHDHQRLRSVG